MEDQVPFKVYTYWNDEEKPEVRRFGIEKTVVTSFHYLNAKLQDVFPGLRNKSYTVSWKDEDDDDVTISSDNEIIIALSMQQRDLMKLYVHCKDKPQEDCKIFVDITGAEAPNNLSHGGVICDGCESQVVGFRYKCTTCDDFDLCSRCEGAGMHPEHLMVRMPMPNMPRNNIRTAHKRSRHFWKAVASQAEDEAKKIRRERSTERKRHSHGHGHGHAHGHGYRRGGDSEKRSRTQVSWLEIFGNYMNEYADLAGDVKIDVENCKTKNKKGDKNQSNGKKEEKSTGNQNSCPFSVENVDFQNIQKFLNTYLGGGDAAPSTSTAKPEAKSQDTANSAAKPQETVNPEAKTQTQVNDVEMDKTDGQSDKISVKSEASTSSEESKREGTPEVEKEKVDGWTVINKEKDFSDAYENAAAGPPIGFNLPEEFQQRVKISEGQNLYPPLNVATAVLNPKETERPAPADQPKPAENTGPSAPTEKEDSKTQTKKHHPLAHIDAAIEQMITMGFSNEDGWLTQLLENKDGNIAAVLDLLTPVNPKK